MIDMVNMAMQQRGAVEDETEVASFFVRTAEERKKKKGSKNRIIQTKEPARMLIFGILVLVLLFIAGMAWIALDISLNLQEAVQLWEDVGPHNTNIGQLRQVLADFWWLGPLKPNPPQNPLDVCGVNSGHSWWTVLWRLREAKERLHCLEEHILAANVKHEDFGSQVFLSTDSLLKNLMTLTLFVLLTWWSRRTTKTPNISERNSPDPAFAAPHRKEEFSETAKQEHLFLTLPQRNEELFGEDRHELIFVTLQQGDECLSDPSQVNLFTAAVEGDEEVSINDQISEDATGTLEEGFPQLHPSRLHRDEEAAVIALKETKRKTWAEEVDEAFPVPDDCLQYFLSENGKWAKLLSEELQMDCEAVDSEVPGSQCHPLMSSGKGSAENNENEVTLTVTVQNGNLENESREETQPITTMKVNSASDQTKISHHVTVVNGCTVTATTGEEQEVHPAPPVPCPVLTKRSVRVPEPRRPYKESGLRLTVPVTPEQRCLVVGPEGEALRKLYQKYGAVRIIVPPREDKTTKGVMLRGPRSQVEAAAQAIKSCLEEAKAKQQRAKMAEIAKKRRVKVTLAVAPNRRRHVVGTRGEILQNILHEYLEVRVTVPPPEDTEAQSISIVGPEDQVSAVFAAISRHLKEVEDRLQEAKRLKKAKKKDHVKVTVPPTPSNRRHAVSRVEKLERRLKERRSAGAAAVPRLPAQHPVADCLPPLTEGEKK